jgi:hypothetical protein
MRHLCHASSAYIVVTITQTRESATAGLQLPMAHVQQDRQERTSTLTGLLILALQAT